MKIGLSEKQYRDLVLAVVLGNWIRGGLFDIGVYDDKNYDQIEDYLLSFANKFNSRDLVENFKGDLIASDALSKKVERLINEYDEMNYWDTIERGLGQRDFYRTITEEERKEMNKNSGWFPDRIHKIYKKYEKEFDKYGISRLEIKK